MANRVTDIITEHLAAAGVHGSGSGTSTLNLNALPAAMQTIVREAYGDATGDIFLISALIAVVGIAAAVFLRAGIRRGSAWHPGSRSPAGTCHPHRRRGRPGGQRLV